MTAYFTMNQTITRPVGEVFATAVSLHEFPRWSPRNPWAKKPPPPCSDTSKAPPVRVELSAEVLAARAGRG